MMHFCKMLNSDELMDTGSYNLLWARIATLGGMMGQQPFWMSVEECVNIILLTHIKNVSQVNKIFTLQCMIDTLMIYAVPLDVVRIPHKLMVKLLRQVVIIQPPKRQCFLPKRRHQVDEKVEKKKKNVYLERFLVVQINSNLHCRQRYRS